MHIVKFTSPGFLTYPFHIAYNNQALTITENIKFYNMYLDFHLTWKLYLYNSVIKIEFNLPQAEKITYCKLKKVMVYFAHFYLQITYDIILWGSPSSMKNVFIIQTTSN